MAIVALPEITIPKSLTKISIQMPTREDGCKMRQLVPLLAILWVSVISTVASAWTWSVKVKNNKTKEVKTYEPDSRIFDIPGTICALTATYGDKKRPTRNIDCKTKPRMAVSAPCPMSESNIQNTPTWLFFVDEEEIANQEITIDCSR